MSISAWCDLSSKADILKLHNKCPNPKGNCQKIITFTPHQYMLEGGSIKCKLQKVFKGTHKLLGVNFLSQVLKRQHQ